ncbi:MAG: hypothetical protein JW819_12190 [Candidatus Krumholzibacteriota bacterium]|nr:hypothetical protein [Candidatus Krumholzibacteriota bacterium]
MKLGIRLAALGALVCLFSVGAGAETATLLALEGQWLPGAPLGQMVSAFNNPAVNHADGWAFTVNTTDGAVTLSHAWGNPAGGLVGTVILTEATYGDYEQTSWEAFYGIADGGQVAYSPLCTQISSGTTGLDAVWVDDVIAMIEEQVYPNEAGMYWSFGSRPGITADGNPYWVGGFTTTQGGSTTNRGLYYGMGAAPIIVGGDTVPGVPYVASTANTVSFDVRYSALGSHWLGEVEFVTGSTANDNYMIYDLAPLMAGGGQVAENSPVPESIGGLTNEAWDNFDFIGVTESGSWMFTGDTNAATTVDEVVVKDGAILYREGDTLDGEVVQGDISHGYMNEEGDIALVWDIQGNTLEALFFNGRLVLKEGDAVDYDGDGNPDANATVYDFTGTNALAITDRDANGFVDIYFTADIDLIPLGKSMPDEAPAIGEEAGLPDTEPRGDREVLEGAFVMTVSTSTGVGEAAAAAPRLVGSWPNPFNPKTDIRFTLPEAQDVTLVVLDAEGRRVRTLHAGPCAAGDHTVSWDGRNDAGRRLASGVYLCRLATADGGGMHKMLMLK